MSLLLASKKTGSSLEIAKNKEYLKNVFFLFHLYFTSVKLYNCNRNNPI